MLLWSLGVPLRCGAVRSCRKCGVCGGCGLIVELSSDLKGSSCLTSCQNRGVFLRFGGWACSHSCFITFSRTCPATAKYLKTGNSMVLCLTKDLRWEIYKSMASNTSLACSHHATYTESYVEWRNVVWKERSRLHRGKWGVTIFGDGWVVGLGGCWVKRKRATQPFLRGGWETSFKIRIGLAQGGTLLAYGAGWDTTISFTNISSSSGACRWLFQHFDLVILY